MSIKEWNEIFNKYNEEYQGICKLCGFKDVRFANFIRFVEMKEGRVLEGE